MRTVATVPQISEEELHSQLAQIETNKNFQNRLIRYFSHLKFNTAKTYLHWMRMWNEWYQEKASKNEDWPATSFPVEEPAFLMFIEDLGDRLRHSSITSCVQALNSIHKKALDHPGIITSEARYILQGLQQKETRKQTVTGQATPFLMKDLKRLIELYSHTRSVRQLRDLCLIWIGFETLLRSAEIRRIRMEDLKIDNMTGEFTLSVYRTKTSVNTNLSYCLTPQLSSCLMRLMNMVGKDQFSHPKAFLFQAVNATDTGYMPPKWLLRSRGNDINELLRRHNMPYRLRKTTLKHGEEPDVADDEGMLSENSLLRAFEGLWKSLYPDETEIRCWTGHSVRVGGAIQLAQNGFTLPQIMEMGNWSSPDMVSRYIRNIEASKKAMTVYMRKELGN